jgi:hypothetical protein
MEVVTKKELISLHSSSQFLLPASYHPPSRSPTSIPIVLSFYCFQICRTISCVRHHCCSLPCVRVPRAAARAAAVIAVAAVVDDVDPPTLGRGLYSVLRGLVQFREVVIVMQQLLMSPSTGTGLVLGSFRRRPPDVLVVKLHGVELVLAELIPGLLLVLHGSSCCRSAGRRGRSKEGRGGGSEVGGNATQRLPPLAA